MLFGLGQDKVTNWHQTSQLYLRTFSVFVLVPPNPGGPEGGSGLSCSFRGRGFGPDLRGGNFKFDFDFYVDLKYSWDEGIWPGSGA